MSKGIFPTGCKSVSTNCELWFKYCENEGDTRIVARSFVWKHVKVRANRFLRREEKAWERKNGERLENCRHAAFRVSQRKVTDSRRGPRSALGSDCQPGSIEEHSRIYPPVSLYNPFSTTNPSRDVQKINFLEQWFIFLQTRSITKMY